MGETYDVRLGRSRKEIAALLTAESVRLTKVGKGDCTLVPSSHMPQIGSKAGMP